MPQPSFSLPPRRNLSSNGVVGAASSRATTITIAPFTLRNLLVSREFVVISSHGGLNFLVGNGPGAAGVYRTLPGITPDIGGQARDATKVAEAAEGRDCRAREVSSTTSRRRRGPGFATSPGAAFSLFLRKIRVRPLRRRGAAQLQLPVVPGPQPRAEAPVRRSGPPRPARGQRASSWRSPRRPAASRRALLVWSTFVPAYVLAVAAFFVATRYRLPLLVALAPPGGAAVALLPEARRAKHGRLGLAAAAGRRPRGGLAVADRPLRRRGRRGHALGALPRREGRRRRGRARRRGHGAAASRSGADVVPDGSGVGRGAADGRLDRRSREGPGDRAAPSGNGDRARRRAREPGRGPRACARHGRGTSRPRERRSLSRRTIPGCS